MITLKFARECNVKKIESVELADYKAFFEFYIAHYDKGIIFDVRKVE